MMSSDSFEIIISEQRTEMEGVVDDAEIEHFAGLLGRLNSKLRDMSVRLESKDELIEKSRKEISDLKDKIKIYESCPNTRCYEDDLKNEVDDLHNTISVKDREIAALKKAMEDTSQCNATLLNEYKQSQKSLEVARKSCHELERELTKASSPVHVNEMCCFKALDVFKKETHANIATLESMIKSLKLTVEATQDGREARILNITDLKDEIVALNEQCKVYIEDFVKERKSREEEHEKTIKAEELLQSEKDNAIRLNEVIRRMNDNALKTEGLLKTEKSKSQKLAFDLQRQSELCIRLDNEMSELLYKNACRRGYDVAEH